MPMTLRFLPSSANAEKAEGNNEGGNPGDKFQFRSREIAVHRAGYVRAPAKIGRITGKHIHVVRAGAEVTLRALNKMVRVSVEG